jgi:hypothetical protein
MLTLAFDDEFPPVIPINFSQASVAACIQMLQHVKGIGIRSGRDVSVVNDILMKIDPVMADGKMRKDRSIDFTLDEAQYLFLAHNTEHFADHDVHHRPDHRVDCTGIMMLLLDMTYAGVCAKCKVDYYS